VSPTTGIEPSWKVFDYEVMMFRSMRALLVIGNEEYDSFPCHLKNAVTESALLHTRQLADILLSRGNQPDDITLQTLLPEFQSRGLDDLRRHYGDNRTPNAPCWIMNKLMAHATTQRGDSFDYSSVLIGVVPLIEGVLEEVQIHRGGGSG